MDCIAAGDIAASGSGMPAAAPDGHDATAAPAASLCMNCDLRMRCLGGAAAAAGTAQLRSILAGRRSLRTWEILYRPGDAFEHVYVVRSGALKSSVRPEGPEQVVGFHFPGELLGVDGMAGGRHGVTVTALEDTQVCAVRFAPRGGEPAGTRALLARLWDMMSCELVRERAHRSLLATLPARRRVTAFLASVTARLRRRGPAGLPAALTGDDIASYLGVGAQDVDAALPARLGTLQ
jgi:CRP/FNR family transcriptional regulator